jgi:hypothetical protein
VEEEVKLAPKRNQFTCVGEAVGIFVDLGPLTRSRRLEADGKGLCGRRRVQQKQARRTAEVALQERDEEKQPCCALLDRPDARYGRSRLVEASTRADRHAAVARTKNVQTLFVSCWLLESLSACVNRLIRSSRCFYTCQGLPALRRYAFGRYGRDSKMNRVDIVSCPESTRRALNRGLLDEEGRPRSNLRRISKMWNHHSSNRGLRA